MIVKTQNAAFKPFSWLVPQLSPSFTQRRSQKLAQAGMWASRAIERVKLKAPVEDVEMRSALCKNRDSRGNENRKMAMGNATEKRTTNTTRERRAG